MTQTRESPPGQVEDHYARLGVARTAPTAVITAAYKALLRETHPDRATDEVDRRRREQAAKDLGEAHAVLSDAVLRARYDLQLRAEEQRRRQANVWDAGSSRGRAEGAPSTRPASGRGRGPTSAGRPGEARDGGSSSNGAGAGAGTTAGKERHGARGTSGAAGGAAGGPRHRANGAGAASQPGMGQHEIAHPWRAPWAFVALCVAGVLAGVGNIAARGLGVSQALIQSDLGRWTREVAAPFTDPDALLSYPGLQDPASAATPALIAALVGLVVFALLGFNAESWWMPPVVGGVLTVLALVIDVLVLALLAALASVLIPALALWVLWVLLQ